MVFGIIPARKGSKGIPGKNMADLDGRPLIAYTLEAASRATKLDRVFLSTDMEEVVAYAQNHYPRIEAPFRRPAELATDTASMRAVVEHWLAFLQANEARTPDVVVLLQPTSPFRRAADIDAALAVFEQEKAVSLVGVSRVFNDPSCIVFKPANGASGFLPLLAGKPDYRRQDYPEAFYINGALYICRTPYFQQQHRFFDEQSRLYVMDDCNSVDVDDPFTLALARGLVSQLATTRPGTQS